PTRGRFFCDVIKHALHWASEASHRTHLVLILLTGALLLLLAIRLEEYKWVVAVPFVAFVGAFLFALFDYAYSLCRIEFDKRVKAENESDQRFVQERAQFQAEIAELKARLTAPDYSAERIEA